MNTEKMVYYHEEFLLSVGGSGHLKGALLHFDGHV